MENLIPEWAPNIHPLLVHFPIAVLITASLADIANVVWPKLRIGKWVLALFAFGGFMLLVTYLSGKQAINSVEVPLKAELTASYHADWALRTLLLYGGYLLVRIVLHITRLDIRRWIAILLLLAGLTGVGFITKTADFGAKLVYKYQVGSQHKSENNL